MATRSISKKAFRPSEKEMINIPIIDKFYYSNGELMYEVLGGNTPRKFDDYRMEDFNDGKRIYS